MPMTSSDSIDWRDDALCAASRAEQMAAANYSADGDGFHALDLSIGRYHIEGLKRICRACPVMAQCQEWAVNSDPDPSWAVWGGLTPREIKALRRSAA